MADIQTLIDMGFPKEKAERALQVTNFKGVEPAMEWLLAHADEIPSSSIEQSTEPIPQTQSESATGEPSSQVSAEPSTTSEADAEAKSIKCDDCGKLFKNEMEVSFHAAKSGHSNFSESTEEKKPLTEEERKVQLALLEAKIKQKRLEREEKEKKEAAEREKNRIRSGKDMLEAKARMEELEMKKMIEQRKREKAAEKAARDRVKAQIEADKAARKAKLAGIDESSPQKQSNPIPAPADSASQSKPAKDYTRTRIQIRLLDGSTLTETFDVKEQLSAVRLLIQLKIGTDLPFRLMTTYPRKIFSDEDFDAPLEALGLVPSAVLTVTKAA